MTITNTTDTKPITAPSSSFVDFVLRRLDIARLRAQLAIVEIETTIAGLRGGLISPEAAILHLHQLDALPLETSSAEAA